MTEEELKKKKEAEQLELLRQYRKQEEIIKKLRESGIDEYGNPIKPNYESGYNSEGGSLKGNISVDMDSAFITSTKDYYENQPKKDIYSEDVHVGGKVEPPRFTDERVGKPENEQTAGTRVSRPEGGQTAGTRVSRLEGGQTRVSRPEGGQTRVSRPEGGQTAGTRVSRPEGGQTAGTRVSRPEGGKSTAAGKKQSIDLAKKRTDSENESRVARRDKSEEDMLKSREEKKREAKKRDREYGDGFFDDRSGKKEKKSSGKSGSKKGKKRKKHRLLKSIVAVILILAIVFVAAFNSIVKKFNHVDTIASEDKSLLAGNIVNILLIGQDARDGETQQRSDSIILLTINRKKNKVILTSFMRDMYVQIPGYGGNRINAAYAFGGIDLLDQTIEENFGIKIAGNAVVDFDGFLEGMTAIGGLDMELTQEEADYMNANPSLGLANDKDGQVSDEVWNLTAGVNHLTSSQVLAYSRMRYVGNSDWDRTERQRKVIMAAVSKVKHGHLLSGLNMANAVAPNITTDMNTMGLLQVAFSFIANGNMQSYHLPVDGTYSSQSIDGMSVLVPDIEANKDYLQQYISGDYEENEE